jgi:hypothetical protein
MKADTTHDLTVGGADLAAQAFEAGLVDECHLFFWPVVLGGGKTPSPGTRVSTFNCSMSDAPAAESSTFTTAWPTSVWDHLHGAAGCPTSPQQTRSEVQLELAGEAIAESGASPAEPIVYEGIRNRYLPEYDFRGKSSQHKSHYALMAAAMVRAGVYPDLVDEAYGWGPDDMWDYAFYALLLYARVASERTGRPLEPLEPR